MNGRFVRAGMLDKAAHVKAEGCHRNDHGGRPKLIHCKVMWRMVAWLLMAWLGLAWLGMAYFIHGRWRLKLTGNERSWLYMCPTFLSIEYSWVVWYVVGQTVPHHLPLPSIRLHFSSLPPPFSFEVRFIDEQCLLILYILHGQ